MIIEITKDENGYAYTKPKNADIAWLDGVSYFDTTNGIFYPDSGMSMTEIRHVKQVCVNLYWGNLYMEQFLSETLTPHSKWDIDRRWHVLWIDATAIQFLGLLVTNDFNWITFYHVFEKAGKHYVMVRAQWFSERAMKLAKDVDTEQANKVELTSLFGDEYETYQFELPSGYIMSYQYEDVP